MLAAPVPQLVQNTFIAAPPKDLVLTDGFRFTHGQTIRPFTIHYETFGELNAEKSNAILVCHALSASAHAAGKFTSSDDERPGWWDGLIGYGKGLDLEKYFVICANIPGSCSAKATYRRAISSTAVLGSLCWARSTSAASMR